MAHVFNGLTEEQQLMVEALRVLIQPLLDEEIPGCCPFSIGGLRKMCKHNPELYHQVAEYFNWPTDFKHLDHKVTRVHCHGANKYQSQHALYDHAAALARRAPPFNPSTQEQHPCEADEDSDDDDDLTRNLQAHVVLRDMYT